MEEPCKRCGEFEHGETGPDGHHYCYACYDKVWEHCEICGQPFKIDEYSKHVCEQDEEGW